MAYEIDFIGVDKSTTDSDAVAMRWKNQDGSYTIGIYDGGIKEYGESLKDFLNKYYFNDISNHKDISEKKIDFVICSHSDQDHTSGLKIILENFEVKKLYMNRPWIYLKELEKYIEDKRMTRKSLEASLRSNYTYISELEKIAEDKGIEICEVFQGEIIEKRLVILSPTKELFLSLIIESDKTRLEESTISQEVFSSKIIDSKKIKDRWSFDFLPDTVFTSAENETSVIVLGTDSSNETKFEYFLLTGDAGPKGLQTAIKYTKERRFLLNNKVTLYQVPHHGGRHNLTKSVMNELVGPIQEKTFPSERIAIVSAGKDSDHPKAVIVNSFIKRGVKVFRTNGYTLNYFRGNMPKRNWLKTNPLPYSDYIEG